MKKKLILLLCVLATITLLVWVFVPEATTVEFAAVTKGKFERAVLADGKTRLRAKYVVSTPLAGRVARIMLKEGESVAQGELLATLTPSAPAMLDARSEEELIARMGAVTATSRRAGVGVERAIVALVQAENQLKRSESLALKGFVSPNQNETERLNVHLRGKELESAKQDAQAARYELAQAQAALKQHTQSANTNPLRAWEVRAPISGKVLKVIQQSEGSIPAGAPLIEIGDPAFMEIVVDILTTEAVEVAPGMPVLMSIGSTTLEGWVRLVEPAAFTKISALGIEEQRVNVIIDITSPPQKWPKLGDGFRVEVRILVQTVADAVMVPVSALFPTENQSAVFFIDGGRIHQKQVDIAARNGINAWVTKGLQPGARVVVYPATVLKEGARVVYNK
jgi:HlyD family secretion protein